MTVHLVLKDSRRVGVWGSTGVSFLPDHVVHSCGRSQEIAGFLLSQNQRFLTGPLTLVATPLPVVQGLGNPLKPYENYVWAFFQ